MKKILLVSCLSIFAAPLFAQEAEEEYELRGNEKYGYVIKSDDQKIEGIVKLVGGESNPWVNQKKVKFIAKADMDASKKRQRFTKMDADDIKEYVAIDDAGNERHFRRIKFVNKREGLMNQSGNGLGGKIKTMKNLTSTTHLAEALVYGKITMYKLYGYPTMVSAGEGDIQRAKQDEEHILSSPDILVQKGDGKVQELEVSDIKDLTEDCKAVQDKMASGGYKTYDPAVQEKKKSGFGKMLKTEVDRSGSKLPDMGKEIFSDYNVVCKD